MSTNLVFSIDLDIVSKSVNLERLFLEISGFTSLKPELESDGDELTVKFAEDISDDQSLACKGVVSQHSGEHIPTIKFHAASKLIQDEVIVNQKLEYQNLSGVLSRPAFFASYIGSSFSVLSGLIKYLGVGVDVLIIQVEQDGTETEVGRHTFTDEGNGNWVSFSIRSDFLSTEEECVYRMDAKLNSCLSASFKICSMTLMEVV